MVGQVDGELYNKLHGAAEGDKDYGGIPDTDGDEVIESLLELSQN